MSDYRYELRRGEEVVATGHFSRERPFEIGERELRLVVQLLRDDVTAA